MEKAKRVPIPRSTAHRIWSRDGWACLHCASVTELVVDHIIPISFGGTNDDDNLQTLCHSCNTRKARTEKPAQKRRVVVSIRMGASGLEAIDSIAFEWSGKKISTRSEVMRCLLMAALDSPDVIAAARLRYAGAHNRTAPDSPGL
jgi:hypothetical protein